MTNDVTAHEARAALADVDRQRRRVVDEIDVPWWYWWMLGGAWVVLGVLGELTSPAISVGATVVFGAVHAAFSPRFLSGQHRSPQLSVRRDLVDRRLPLYVFAGLLVAVAVTIALALVLDADGARHPSIIASCVVAVLVVVGGPRLTAAARRRATGPA